MPFDSLLLQAAEEGFGNRIVPTVSSTTHAGNQLVVLASAIEIITAKLGRFNRSSQHWVVDWILDSHLMPRLVSSSRVFSRPSVQRIGDGVDLLGGPSELDPVMTSTRYSALTRDNRELVDEFMTLLLRRQRVKKA